MVNKEDIRPIYTELQGYLEQVPENKMYNNSTINASPFDRQLEELINQLKEITGKNYDRFKIETHISYQDGSRFTYLDGYKSNLGGLISRLHGEFFSDEQPPFSNMPNTVINQSQNQSQSVEIEIVYEIMSVIADKSNKYKEDSKEKKFLDKLKDLIKNTKNVVGVIRLILKLAGEFGLTMQEVVKIFT